MELMAMTTQDKFRSEIYIVIKLFENGLETLHLKKPKFSSPGTMLLAIAPTNIPYTHHIIILNI